MKFSAFIVSMSAAGAAAGSSHRMSKDFMHAMQEPSARAARKKANANKVRELNESLMKASRKLQNNGQYYNYGADYNTDGVADGYYVDGQYFAYEEAPFDMTSRAFKYSGCAAIKTYDAESADENGNPMVMDTFAVFRLCPADKCNQYSITGCSKNYGEYAIEMNTYLSYVLGYYEDRYDDYCEFCEACDWEYQAKAKSTLSNCYAKMTKWQSYQGYSQSSNAYQMQQQANQNAASSNQAANYNKYYYGNSNANNGGRKMEDAAADADADNQAQTDDNQVNQQASAYGYYDENGDWIDGDSGAGGQFGYWGADGVFYPYDQEINYGEAQECMGGTQCDYCTYQNEQVYSYCDSYVCGDYYTYCSDLYKTDQQIEFDPTEYLECTAWDNNGQIYYIAPHCGSDHYTISLGVFSDENCVEYIGEDISLSTVLGFQYENNDVLKVPKECISCDGAEEYAEQGSSGQGVYGEYVASPQTTYDGVVAMCSALYSGSAQCNMNMNNFAYISRYMSQYELDLEARYCAFIENIIYGSYDESGEILLKPEAFDFADWRNPRQYKTLRMAPSQAIGLSLSIILCIALLAAAAVTNRSLTRSSSPWKPSRSDVSLSRQNSGIVLGRSRSGPGAAPLI